MIDRERLFLLVGLSLPVIAASLVALVIVLVWFGTMVPETLGTLQEATAAVHELADALQEVDH